MNAVVVDSSVVSLNVSSTFLTRAGFTVHRFGSAAEAFSQLPTLPLVSIVCVSLVTEDWSGLDFCRRLRVLALYRAVPVLLLTSSEASSIREEAMDAGITDVFYKADLAPFQRFLADFNRYGAELHGRVLYVEDSLTAANVFRDWLAPFPVQIDHFESAEEALVAFDQVQYDIVVSDYLLKGKQSGLGLTQVLRSEKKSPIPILILSALENPSRKLEIFRSGASDFVPKPATREELLARMGNLLTSKRLWDEVLEQKQILSDLALKDQLTQLYNRHSLVSMAPQVISEARRHGYPLSLIVLDLDHFKQVNDNYGHQAGDSVLIQVASVLRNSLREGDYTARFGGEEFVMILPHCDLKGARQRAEGLRSLVEGLNPNGIGVTISLGISSLGQGVAWGFEQLFSAGDTALYRAKSEGRNRVVACEQPEN